MKQLFTIAALFYAIALQPLNANANENVQGFLMMERELANFRLPALHEAIITDAPDERLLLEAQREALTRIESIRWPGWRVYGNGCGRFDTRSFRGNIFKLRRGVFFCAGRRDLSHRGGWRNQHQFICVRYRGIRPDGADWVRRRQ